MQQVLQACFCPCHCRRRRPCAACPAHVRSTFRSASQSDVARSLRSQSLGTAAAAWCSLTEARSCGGQEGGEGGRGGEATSDGGLQVKGWREGIVAGVVDLRRSYLCKWHAQDGWRQALGTRGMHAAAPLDARCPLLTHG